MPPIDRDETQPPAKPSSAADTLKHIPTSPNLVETEDSNVSPTISHAHRTLQPGKMINHYQLVEIVGEGSFGVVWKAQDKQLDRSVAIKIPKFNYTTEREQAWFFREGRAAAKLKHPSIVAVYEVGQVDNIRYIASEFIQGEPLSEFLKSKRLGHRAAAELSKQIADAVAHAHENGITHRDLKPSNILMDAQAQPHLLDFGLAKLEVVDQTLTADDLVLGTPGYMSPEQARGASRDSDARSDVYSMGIILFQLLTHELPFRGTFQAVIRHHIETPAPSTQSLDRTIPNDLDTIVLKCLEKAPQHRFPDAMHLSDELARFLNGQPLSCKPQGPITRFLRWFMNNREVSINTTGISFVAIGTLLVIWGCLGLIFVGTGMARVRDMKETLREIFMSLLTLQFPTVLVGIAILRRLPGAVQAGLCLSTVGMIVALAGSFGWMYPAHVFGNDESRWPLFHLLAVFAAGGFVLTSASLAVDRWHHAGSKQR